MRTLERSRRLALALRALLAAAVFAGGLSLARPSSAEPAPPLLSDGVVHYEVAKLPAVPQPCIVFANEDGKTERFGPCSGRTLIDYLGPEAKYQGGLAVVWDGGREWRLSRRVRSGKLADVPLALLRDAGFDPVGPLSVKEVAGAPRPTVRGASVKVVSKTSTGTVASCEAFEVAGYYYGIVVSGTDAAAVEADLGTASSMMLVEASPRVARYTGPVIYAIGFGLGIAALVAVVSFFVVRSARIARQRELEAAEAMARGWNDRAR
jgi:hypothetical protein